LSCSDIPTQGRTPARKPSDPDLVDRLARLRTILPLLATDLATARRRTHALELENHRLGRRIDHLTGRIAELEAELACSGVSQAGRA